LANLINDISTDLEDPPAFFAEGNQIPPFDVQRAKEIMEKKYGDIGNLELRMSPAEGFALVRLLVGERGWKVVEEADSPFYKMQAVARTLVLRFPDDVVIEVRPRSGGCTVAMRSRSRLGKSDLGANARRIRSFLADL